MKKIPQNVLYAIKSLEKQGFSAYVVGGAVRDFLMGKIPTDFDITTNALPCDIIKAFPNEKKVLTGQKHGTVAPIIDGEMIEITTFRIDGEYKDSRHPEEVMFSPLLEEDLKRRDFTINAIAMDKDFNIKDPFFGRADIEKGVIRCVGKADKRFSEDALRIMRALRFSSVLGFTIEEETERAISDKKELLQNVSKERIFTELKKLLEGKDRKRVLKSYKDVFLIIMPLIKSGGYNVDFLDSDFIDVNFAILFEGMKKEDKIKTLKDLRADKKLTESVIKIGEITEKEMDSLKDIRYLLKDYDKEFIQKAILKRFHQRDINEGEKESLGELLLTGDKVGSRVEDLLIGGDDLKNLGFEGAKIGKVLEELLVLVIEEKCENKRQDLLKCAKMKLK